MKTKHKIPLNRFTNSAICSICGKEIKPGEWRSIKTYRCKSCHDVRLNFIKHKQMKIRKHLTPQPCIICGNSHEVNGHHPDYSKPFEVIWLCRRHHMQLHANKLSLPPNAIEEALSHKSV